MAIHCLASPRHLAELLHTALLVFLSRLGLAALMLRRFQTFAHVRRRERAAFLELPKQTRVCEHLATHR